MKEIQEKFKESTITFFANIFSDVITMCYMVQSVVFFTQRILEFPYAME